MPGKHKFVMNGLLARPVIEAGQTRGYGEVGIGEWLEDRKMKNAVNSCRKHET